jgi:HSP20 family protein
MDTRRDVELVEPGALMRRMLRDADRLLAERPASTSQDAPGFAEPQGVPPLEIVEREGSLIVRVVLPGLEKEDVSVTVSGDAPAIADDEPRCEADEDRQDATTTEPTDWTFLRTIALPEGFDAAAVTATFADGVLELTIPLPPVASGSAVTK